MMRRTTKPIIDDLVDELIQSKINQRLAKMVQREKRKANKEMDVVRELLALPAPDDAIEEAEVIEAEEEPSGGPVSFKNR